MKSDSCISLVVPIIFIWLMIPLCALGAKVEPLEIASEQMETCSNASSIVLSGVYSPYSVHLIKAETAGRIAKINAREGEVLPAKTPIMEIDYSALAKQLKSLKEVLSALYEEKKILLKNLGLIKKKYQRYLRLKEHGHIEEQLVEDMEAKVNSAHMSVIDNRRRIAETERAIADMEERIKKSRPLFDRPLYVSQNFKEIYETVVPGENLSRLLDISKAKIHLVLSLSCFKQLETALSKDKKIHFSIILPDSKVITIDGKVEKLKIDPDNRYLYSYGFDLVFQPVKGLLWGQVIRVRLGQ